MVNFHMVLINTLSTINTTIVTVLLRPATDKFGTVIIRTKIFGIHGIDYPLKLSNARLLTFFITILILLLNKKRGISMQAQRYLSFIHQTSLLRQSSPSDFHLNPICNGDTPCKECLFGKSMPFNLRCHRHHSTRQVYHLSCTGRLQRSYQWHGQFPCSCQKQAGYCHYTDKCPRFVR